MRPRASLCEIKKARRRMRARASLCEMKKTRRRIRARASLCEMKMTYKKTRHHRVCRVDAIQVSEAYFVWRNFTHK